MSSEQSNKENKDSQTRDWRDPSKPRNPEDDVIVDGWKRLPDGTFVKVEEKKDNK